MIDISSEDWGTDPINPNPCYPALKNPTNRKPTTQPSIMSNLLTIPNEILDQITSNLDAFDTSHLLLSCRSLAAALTPAMHLHAVAPKYENPALHWAAQRGHVRLLEFLLTRFPVDLLNDDCRTPLQEACYSGHSIAAAECLLLRGASVNHISSDRSTVLYYACRCRLSTEDIAEPFVRLLLAHGADASAASQTALISAVDCRYPRIARLLLEAGADPDARTVDDVPVVVTAARYSTSVTMLELLLDFGADAEAVNPDGRNALLMSTDYGTLENVQLMVSKGVGLGCRDREGNTPLILAIKSGCRDIAEYLAELDGVDVDSANVHEYTPWSLAVWRKFDDVLQILRRRGAAGSS